VIGQNSTAEAQLCKSEFSCEKSNRVEIPVISYSASSAALNGR
jgi:hypothetical protein